MGEDDGGCARKRMLVKATWGSMIRSAYGMLLTPIVHSDLPAACELGARKSGLVEELAAARCRAIWKERMMQAHENVLSRGAGGSY